MTTGIINVAFDAVPTPALELVAAAWRETIPQTRIELEPNTLLAMCADGALLACRYMTSRELVSMLRQNRLMDIVTRLKARSQWAYLILVGSITSTYAGKLAIDEQATDWDWSAIQGALVSIQEAGVTVWQIGREPHLPGAIETIAKRSRTPNRIRPVREALFVSETEDMLMALPGVGEQRCESLLRYTNGSGGWALVALLDPESKIPGIGPELKSKARKALKLDDDMTFTIICKEGATNDRSEHPDTVSQPAEQPAAAAA